MITDGDNNNFFKDIVKVGHNPYLKLGIKITLKKTVQNMGGSALQQSITSNPAAYATNT